MTDESGELNYEPCPFQSIDVEYLSYDENCELDPSLVHKLNVCLGSGYYGEVWLGFMLEKSGSTMVAIKMPKQLHLIEDEDEMKSERNSIRNEIKILSYIGNHENLLLLKGALTLNKDRFWMVLEFCELGSLDKYLNSKRTNLQFIDEIVKSADDISGTIYKAQVVPEWSTEYVKRRKDGFVTTSDLLHFGLQTASGMDFLHGKGIVHRDLALRNILLDDNYTVKIADFGLSRQTRNGYYTRSGEKAIPLFWTAPEALKSSRVLLESDWWTFGVVLWELFELGGIPYDGVSGQDLVEYLENGSRLEQPEHSPVEIYQLMRSLWNIEPLNRPSLTSCQQIIRHQLKLACPLLVPDHAAIQTPDLPPPNRSETETVAEVLEKEVFIPTGSGVYRQFSQDVDGHNDCYDWKSMGCCEYVRQHLVSIFAPLVILIIIATIGASVFYFTSKSPPSRTSIQKFPPESVTHNHPVTPDLKKS